MDVKSFPASSGLCRPFVSFANVVASKGMLPRDDGSIKETVVQFTSSESERCWLKKYFTASLKKVFSWANHGDELKAECAGNFWLRSLGGSLILIQNNTDNLIETIREDWDEWIAHWFSWFRSWNPSDVSKTRSVWTRWSGVPVHAWSCRFFELMCDAFGTFTKMDFLTENCEMLLFARILVEIPIDAHIPRLLKCLC